MEVINYQIVASRSKSMYHWNSTAPDADINLPPAQLLPFPRVFLANKLNLVPADGGAAFGCSWLADEGGGFRLLAPVSWQLPVLPELVDGYTQT